MAVPARAESTADDVAWAPLPDAGQDGVYLVSAEKWSIMNGRFKHYEYLSPPIWTLSYI